MGASQDAIVGDRRLYSVSQTRDQLGGISHEKLYQLVRTGQLEVVKLGRRTFVKADELDRFVNTLPYAS